MPSLTEENVISQKLLNISEKRKYIRDLQVRVAYEALKIIKFRGG